MTTRESSVDAQPTRRDWLGLATMSVALGMIVLDGTIVGVALPSIIGDLGLDLTDAQWVNSLYAALLASILLVTGRLADRFGRKPLLLVGIVVFVLGSVLAAASADAGTLIGARAVQAVGAAAIMPSTLSTVNAVFRGRHRAAAFGVWGAVISGAAAVGPLAGGALTQYASWRWIFLVNIPIGAIVLVAAWLTVQSTRGESRAPGIDVDGTLLSAIGFGALVFAVIEGPDLGWWAPTAPFSVLGLEWPQDAPVSVVPVLFLISAVAITLFVVWERHRHGNGRSALLDTELFRIPTFSWGNVAAGTVAVGEFAIVFVLPLYLIDALGLDVMTAGLILAAMAVGAFLSGAAARHLAARIGATGTVVLGLALELVGVGLLALVLSATTPGWIVAMPLTLYGLGLGLASAQLTGTVLRDVPTQQSGQASAAQSTVRQIGSALGTALSGVALSVALAITLPASLSAAGVSEADAADLAATTRETAGASIEQLRAAGGADDLVAALADGFAGATRIALLVAAAFLTLGLVASLRVRSVARQEAAQEDVAQQDAEASAG